MAGSRDQVAGHRQVAGRRQPVCCKGLASRKR